MYIYISSRRCFDEQTEEHNRKCMEKINEKFDLDPDSPLRTYYRINPDLQAPDYNVNVSCHELERKTLTKYRTGCFFDTHGS